VAAKKEKLEAQEIWGKVGANSLNFTPPSIQHH